MKKLLTIFMLLLVILTLTACTNDSNPAAGTYELTQMEARDVKVTPDNQLWKTATGGKSATMTLEDDGSCSVSLFGETGEGSYEVKDATVTITINGDPQDFELEDGNLTAEISGTKMIFEKK